MAIKGMPITHANMINARPATPADDFMSSSASLRRGRSRAVSCEEGIIARDGGTRQQQFTFPPNVPGVMGRAVHRTPQSGTIGLMEPIYLDHNATTPVRPEVIAAMARCYGTIYANPASQHRPGQHARRTLDDARQQIADILGADLAAPRRDRLIFTSGGTEANNLAIFGIARAGGPPGQLIISAGEHQSVIEPAEHLLERGWRLDTLGLTSDGVVRVEQLPPSLGPPTRLVSVLLGNHETGVLQPVAELAALCRQAGVPLHTDAIQVVGKLPVNFRTLGVAAMSVTGHKFGGPLGIGALLVRDGVPIEPLMFGGHQQSGERPGTESAALAVGMATALALWQKEQDQYARRLQTLRDRFERGLREGLENVLGRQLYCRPGSGSTSANPTSIVVHGAGARACRKPATSPSPALTGKCC